MPLINRLAVLINEFEDLKIINKLQQQGRRAIENNEYYNDLLEYRKYPYINFKDFQKNGFQLTLNKTANIIRSVSLLPKSDIQLRTGSEAPVNIIGFLITGSNKPWELFCLTQKSLLDIRTSPSDNGYTAMINYIKTKFFDSQNIKNYYWLFDTTKDIIELGSYELTTKISETKIIASKIYDDILNLIYNKLTELINKSKKLTIQNFYKLLNFMDSKIFQFPKNTDLFNKLEFQAYYEKIIKFPDKYDSQTDKFFGLYGEITKLPSAPKIPPAKINTITINLSTKISKKLNTGPESESAKYGAICQHFITWENISAIRKKNPNKFASLFYEFVQRYVTKNYEDEIICKSCSTQINLKNYVLDGSYDEEGRFVSFNIPMEIPIEDIPEYEKYNSIIRNIEKMVEKIATIANINTLIGNSITIKSRIKRIVKDTIDLVLLHNSNLKNIYKDRAEKINSYGLSKDFSNLFVFELDNSIFVYSSKDKDFYKPIKRNNILVYILFLIILELSQTQLYYMTGDKTCNYYLFSKYAINWFTNIKILKNNNGELIPILEYKLLCYVIFYISCLVAKYNMWYYESEKTKKKFDPTIQKFIIQTLIDLINSVIEINSNKKNKKKNYLYELISNKFHRQLNFTYNKPDILDRIKLIEEKKILPIFQKPKNPSRKYLDYYYRDIILKLFI